MMRIEMGIEGLVKTRICTVNSTRRLESNPEHSFVPPTPNPHLQCHAFPSPPPSPHHCSILAIVTEL